MMERTTAQGAALAAELRNVLLQAQKLVTALGDDREQAMTELRQRLQAAVLEAQQRLAGLEAQARDLKENARAAADNYVRDNPWTTVGVSAALGLIIGSWLACGSNAADGQRDAVDAGDYE